MKVVAVTGGAQGIGRAVACAFAARGYAVSIADPARDAGEEAVEAIHGLGLKAIHEPADVGVADDVTRWMTRTAGELGCPDVLVNNAGIGRRAPFLDLAMEDFDRVLAVNLRGTFLCSQAAARCMAERGEGGAIVNVASTRAFMSEPGTEAYSASKGGIVALTHAMAISLAEQRIRVNCISPGWIETCDWQAASRARPPRHSERDRLQHPVGRVGTPEDIAEACVFLAEGASFVTGQNLIVDGGMTVKMIYEE
jgi:NAD(P)-dependent dehydrogenase (short-subunit alcohol dehydrogenase family)